MKTIPIELLDHQAQEVTTECFLVKVVGVGPFRGVAVGFNNLDVDVEYDDLTGDGDTAGIIYRAPNGFIPKQFRMSSSAMIDNSAIDGVVTDTGITEQQIRAGFFRSAKMTIYRVNYEDLTAGRHEIMAYGRGGRTRFSRDGFSVDFRDLSDLLRQPIGPVISTTCRAIFGSKPIGTGGDQPEELHSCGVDWEWETYTVDSVGAESDRQFGASGIAHPEGYFDLGVVEWLTGDNAGQEMEVDYHTGDSGSAGIDLSWGMPAPIQTGDTFRIRRDCDKLFATCRDVFNNKDRFRGEHLTPLDGTAMVPGAEIIRA